MGKIYGQNGKKIWAERVNTWAIRVKNIGSTGKNSVTILSEVRVTLSPFSRNSCCSTNFVSVSYTKFDNNLLNGLCRY